MPVQKSYNLWKPVDFSAVWKNCDTSILDDLSASWFSKRKKLNDDSIEYIEFMNRLKREHAIETGIIERLYNLDIGITETFIKDGFVKNYLSHGDTNIPEDDLMSYLNDHEEAINFVFDVVKEDRPFSTSFIKALHQLVTRNQKFAEGRDQFGRRTEIPLLKGKYKTRENNPTGKDGTIIKYCPPEHVESEMENLIRLYDEYSPNTHSLIMATWFHHAFTTIHPFQDGNGRIARLIASLIFIKYNLFPFTVKRDERVSYIKGLESADKDEPQALVDYFATVQKNNIEKSLNLELEFAGDSLEAVQDILVKKVGDLKYEEQKKLEDIEFKQKTREKVFLFCKSVMEDYKNDLENKLSGKMKVSLWNNYHKKLNEGESLTRIPQWVNKSYSKIGDELLFGHISLNLSLDQNKKFKILSYVLNEKKHDRIMGVRFNDNPESHRFSIADDFESKKKNIRKFMDEQLTIELAKIIKKI